jgi:hypothetical protein
MHKRSLWGLLILALIISACDGLGGGSEPIPPTATLAPIVSMTPRFTATPIPSRTPTPTETLTPSTTPIPPSPTETFTPSPTPPVLGVVASLQSVNVREGPGVDFGSLTALRPGTGVEVLGTDASGAWLNILMEDGTQGWISSSLVRLQNTPTPLPSLTPTPDLTLLAAGTSLPTALFGGGTVTPTPPRAVVTPTIPPTRESLQLASPTPGEGTVVLPNIETINQTATALVGGIVGSPTPIGLTPGQPTPTISALVTTPGSASTPGGASSGTVQRARVFAYCDVPGDPYQPPTGLAPGSSIVIFWSWFARTPDQVRDHIAAVQYEIFLDGRRIEYAQFQGSVEQRADGNYWVDWAVPAGPLDAGQHRITYRVSWTRSISDGYAQFGPGTPTESESGTCTFTVQ